MIWFEGALHESSSVRFDLADRGLLLGDGLFETIAVFGHQPFQLPYHLDRLSDGASRLGFAVDRTVCGTAITALAAHARAGRGVVRLTVTRGVGDRGLAPPAQPKPHIHASLAPWHRDMAFRPTRLATLSIRRNETSPLSNLKTLAYLDNVLGHVEATAKGADDGLFLNGIGHVASSTMANVFVVKAGILITPPLADGALAGTIRQLLLTHGVNGMPVSERSLVFDEVLSADEMFLTNSVRLVMPVSDIDGTALGSTGAARVAFGLLSRLIEAECGDEIESGARYEERP
jgi:branched-chain amino acid aminotransferase